MQTSNTIMVVAFDSSLGCTTNCTTQVKKLSRRKKMVLCEGCCFFHIWYEYTLLTKKKSIIYVHIIILRDAGIG